MRLQPLCLAGLAAVSCHGGRALDRPPDRAGAATAHELPATPVAPELRGRAELAPAFAKVKPGMTAAEVTTLLGKPDDVRTAADGITAARTVEIWSYGADAHGGFATLGTVHLMADQTVQYVWGGGGTPLAASVIGEVELRPILRTLDRVASPFSPDRYDPRTVIDAVNALVALGPDRAEKVLREYLRVAPTLDDPGREGAILVMRTLFDVPDAGILPPPMLGAPAPPAPTDGKLVPRFPIVLEGDIPFLVAQGYVLGGEAEPAEMHLDHLLAVATIRRTPLAPVADARAAADRVLARLGTGGAGLKDFLAAQAAAMSAAR